MRLDEAARVGYAFNLPESVAAPDAPGNVEELVTENAALVMEKESRGVAATIPRAQAERDDAVKIRPRITANLIGPPDQGCLRNCMAYCISLLWEEPPALALCFIGCWYVCTG